MIVVMVLVMIEEAGGSGGGQVALPSSLGITFEDADGRTTVIEG